MLPAIKICFRNVVYLLILNQWYVECVHQLWWTLVDITHEHICAAAKQSLQDSFRIFYITNSIEYYIAIIVSESQKSYRIFYKNSIEVLLREYSKRPYMLLVKNYY